MRPTVHPRACGERALAGAFGRVSRGSSPRLRGTDALAYKVAARQRFIPAPAGNGRPAFLLSCFPAIHPRACGERLLGVYLVEIKNGSSPRLRGTAPGTLVLPAPLRFIPAPAGNGSYGKAAGKR